MKAIPPQFTHGPDNEDSTKYRIAGFLLDEEMAWEVVYNICGHFKPQALRHIRSPLLAHQSPEQLEKL